MKTIAEMVCLCLLAIDKIIVILDKLRYEKIHSFETFSDRIVFKGRRKQLFILHKGGRHSVYFTPIDTIAFQYFGCDTNDDSFEFAASDLLKEKLKKKLSPSALPYEEKSFRF